MSREAFEFLKEMQGKERSEHMMVLFLAPGALDFFTGE